MPKWTAFWAVEEGTAADTFNVYTRRKGGDWTLAGTTAGNRFEVTVPDTFDVYQVGIATVLNAIEASEEWWEIIDFLPGSTEDFGLPADPGAFVVEQIDQSFDVRARWQPVDDPHLLGYEIREGADWETGIVRHFAPGNVPSNAEGWIEAGFGMIEPKSTTFQMKTISEFGEYSQNATPWTIGIQIPNTYKPETPVDEKAGGFAGTKTDTEVSGGNLRLTVTPSTVDAWSSGVVDDYDKLLWLGHYGTGTYVTEVIEALDDAANGIVADEVVTLDLEGSKVTPATLTVDQMSAVISPALDADGDPNDPHVVGPYDYVYVDETVKYGLELGIEIRTTEDDPGGSPTWTPYRPFVPGARYRYRAVQLRFTVTCRWNWVWSISKMTIRRWRRNLKDEALVVDDEGSGAKAVTFTEPFTKAPVVQATVESASGAYATVDPSSVTRTGCNIYIWDDGDPATQIMGTAHVTAAGV